jgi:hypothetical protein
MGEDGGRERGNGRAVSGSDEANERGPGARAQTSRRRGGAAGRKKRGPDGWAPCVSERGRREEVGAAIGPGGRLGLGFFLFLFYLKI